jgi:predicted trehalose synthase
VSLPTPERLGAARWFGGKAGAIGRIEECDRLDLGGGAALSILRVDGADLYVWSEGEAAAALLRSGSAPERGAWQFRGTGVTLPTGAAERPIGLDQSNTSYVVDERLVVKVYRRIWPGVHPEVELGRHLTEAAHLDCVPAFAGSLHWSRHAVALVQEYVPGEDGWAWGAAAVQSGDVRDIGRLGAESARLHAALAGYGASVATAADLRGWREAARAQLESAIAAVPDEVAAQLRDLRSLILAELDGLESPAGPVALQRLHGDFHIGQVVRAAGGRLVVVDLEGEPTKPVAERSRPGPALRDVAAMLRSFDHLGRYVAREVDPGCDVDGWIARAREAYLSAYGPVDEALPRAFEIEKETYEFTYAAAFLPEWMYAPVGGMRWLMEHGG